MQTTTLASGLSQVNDVCVDNLGNAYVTSDAVIQMVDSSGTVTTIVGDGTVGHSDGAGLLARLNYARGIDVDAVGTLYFAEQHYVRKAVFSSGAYTVSTLAGDGSAGLVDDTGTAARFNSPEGVRLDGHGNVFVVDCLNHAVRKVTPEGVVTTLVGTGSAGSVNGVGTAASFNAPYQLVIDANGDGYVTDRGNHLIRKVTEMTDFPTPRVLPITTSTFAGSGSDTFSEGTGTAAGIPWPLAVAADRNTGDVYVGDDTSKRLIKITSAGVVTSLAGSGATTITDGTGDAASFCSIWGLAVQQDGSILATDFTCNRVRKVTTTGVVTTLAGSGSTARIDGTGTAAAFDRPVGVAVSNQGMVYISESCSIRQINWAGEVTTLLGGTCGFVDGTTATARIYEPWGLAMDRANEILYIAGMSQR